MATRSLKLARARTQTKWDTFLTPHSADVRFDGETLVDAVLQSPKDGLAASRSLREKLDSAGADTFIIPPVRGASDLVPGDSPLIDKIMVKSGHNGAWKFPSTASLKEFVSCRQFTGEVASSMDIMVHTLFEDPVDNLSQLLSRVEEKIDEEEELWPCSAVTLAVTNVYLKDRDFSSVLAPSNRNSEVNFISYKKEAANIRPFATKIIISGLKWAMVLQFPVNDDGKMYTITNAAIPDVLIDWLFNLPAVAVTDLSDAFIVEQMIQVNRSNNFSFNAVVEMEALATLAGFRSNVRDITVLSYLTTGSLCRLFTRIDHPYFILPWYEIPEELRWSLLGVVRATYSVHRVLKLSLLYDIFPDPDVATQLTRTTTHEFMVWFSSWVNFVLNHTSPDSDIDVASFDNRGDLAAILVNVNKDGYTEGISPASITNFASLFQSWPSLSYGGARFLIQAREAFLMQYTNMTAASKLKGFEDMFGKELSPFQKSHARYGYLRDDIENLNFGIPVKSECSNLVVHIDQKKMAMILDPRRTVYPADVSLEIQYTKRQARVLVEEWARLNVELIPVLFDRMKEKTAVLNKYAPFYEKLRTTYQNLGKKNPVFIQDCETRVERGMLADSSESVAKLSALNDHIEQLEGYKVELQAAIDQIQDNQTRGIKVDRSCYRDHIMGLPSFKFIARFDYKSKKTQFPKFRNPSEHCEELTPDDIMLERLGNHPQREASVPAPDTSRAAKRARSRSVQRPELEDHTSSSVQPAKRQRRERSASRTSGRRARSRSKKAQSEHKTPAQDLLRGRSPQLSSKVEKNLSQPSNTGSESQPTQDQTPLRDEIQSPVIELDFPSPTTQLEGILAIPPPDKEGLSPMPPVELLDIQDDDPKDISMDEAAEGVD